MARPPDCPDRKKEPAMNAPTDPTMPEWDVAQWFNTQQPISLADLRGQVVLIHG